MIANVSQKDSESSVMGPPWAWGRRWYSMVDRPRALELGKFGFKSQLSFILTVYFEHVTEPF